MRLPFAVVSFVGMALLAAGCGSDPQPVAVDPLPPAVEQRLPAVEPSKEYGLPAALPNSTAPAVPKPDLVYVARVFGADFHNGEKGAIRKYGEKLIEVNGVVTEVFRYGSTPRMYVSEASSEDFSVECVFENEEAAKRALPGRTVKVQGRAIGGVLYPGLHLFECRMYSVSGKGPDELTVAELAKAYAEDSAKVKANYGGRHLILTGKIEAIERFDGGSSILELTRKHAGILVRAHFANVEDPRNRSFEDGQKIRFLCKLSKFDDACFLHNCHLLPAAK